MVRTIEDEAIRDKVATSCRIMARECPGRSQAGHVSVRGDDGQSILIKARGPEEEGLDFVRSRDIIRLDLNGAPLDAPPGLTPPAETAIHLAMYRANPDTGSVIHVHPRVVVALTAAKRELLPIYNAYDPAGLNLVENGIPVFPKSVLISNEELGNELAAAMGDKRVCVLNGHGIVTVGRDVEEATALAVNLTELAQINWMAYSIGDPVPIPDDDRERSAMGPGGRGPARRRSDGTTANWHWLRQRAAQV